MVMASSPRKKRGKVCVSKQKFQGRPCKGKGGETCPVRLVDTRFFCFFSVLRVHPARLVRMLTGDKGVEYSAFMAQMIGEEVLHEGVRGLSWMSQQNVSIASWPMIDLRSMGHVLRTGS